MKTHRVLLLLVTLAACKGKPATQEEPKEHEAEHGEHGGLITLTQEQMATAHLETAKVERRAASGFLEATAQIDAASDRQARIGPRVAGRIVELRSGVGDRVKKGTVLAVIDSPELGRVKAEYLSALASANVAREAAEREQSLFEKKIASEREWREAQALAVKSRAEKEAAENRLHALGVEDADLPTKVEGHYTSTVPVAAPIDGVVVERTGTLGEMVEPAAALFVVMDLRIVWILVDVFERDLAQVKMGQKARIKVSAYPDRELTGRVEHIGAVVEAKSRAVKVRVLVDNAEGLLKPGMFATVALEGTAGETAERLVAPKSAIQRDGDRTIVFVPVEAHRFAVRVVKVARELGDGVEVERGLSEGDMVVTSGSFALKSEMKKSELGEGDEH